jgi:hypothetical protein
MNASAWISFVVLLLVAVTIALELRELLSRLPDARTAEAMDALFDRAMLTSDLTFGAGLAVALAALGVSIRAALRRQQAREAEQQDMS